MTIAASRKPLCVCTPELCAYDNFACPHGCPEVVELDKPGSSLLRFRAWRESARVFQVHLGRFDIGVTLRPHRMRRRWEIKRWSV